MSSLSHQHSQGVRRLSGPHVAAAALLWVLGVPAAAAADRPAPDLEAGRAAYQASCARCHGAAGQADGPDAKRFYPRPRDLTKGVYKFRSTASGTPPTDDDLFDTIARGLPGSNMPDWPHLDEATRWHVVEYLKSLAPIFQDTAAQPVEVASDPGVHRADVVKGRVLYEQMGCAACHGAQGRANGTSAAGLVDDWGMPIRPANLTQGWDYPGWPEPRDIMLRLLTGIDGAGMPSYAGAISPQDAWHLAYYVASLQEPAAWHAIIDAPVVHGTLPTTPNDPQWVHAAPSDLRVRNAVDPDGAWAHPPTVTAVRVQALATHDAVAFRLTWDDPVENREDPADRIALVLQPEGVRGDVVSLQLWPASGSPPLDFLRWSPAQGAREVVAYDYDAAQDAASRAVPLTSQGTYADGRWTLVFQRPLVQPDVDAARAIQPGALTALAVAVWEGSNPQARAVSSWVELAIEAPAASPARHSP